MLLLLLLLKYGAAEKSIMIIGGWLSNGTVEKFNPRTMQSAVIQQDARLTAVKGHKGSRVTPVNDTHALVIAPGGIFYIDTSGSLTEGPETDDFQKYAPRTFHLTSLPAYSANGQLRPMYCIIGGQAPTSQIYETKECKVLSSDRRQFVYHSTPIDTSKPWQKGLDELHNVTRIHSLTTFGEDVIAISSSFAQRFVYTESNWKTISPPPEHRFESAAVKLNDSTLLLCGALIEQGFLIKTNTECYVYNLDRDQWFHGPKMKFHTFFGEIALVDQTVYAFGGRYFEKQDYKITTAVQTLDVSKGVENAQWTLETSAQLKSNHSMFGVWVFDEPELDTPKARAEKSYAYAVVYLVGMFLITVAAIIVFVRM